MLKYQIVIGALCFALGVTAVLAIQNYRNSNGHSIATASKLFNLEGSIDNNTLDSFFDDDFFRSSKSPFEEMEQDGEKIIIKLPKIK